MYACISHLWYSGPRTSSKLLEDDWRWKCFPLFSSELLFPPSVEPLFISSPLCFCIALALLLLPFPPLLPQFKLQTGIMQEVMGCRNGAKNKNSAWQSSFLVRILSKRISRYIVNRFQTASCSLYVRNNWLFSVFPAPLANIYCTSPAGEIRLLQAPLGREQNGLARTSIH